MELGFIAPFPRPAFLDPGTPFHSIELVGKITLLQQLGECVRHTAAAAQGDVGRDVDVIERNRLAAARGSHGGHTVSEVVFAAVETLENPASLVFTPGSRCATAAGGACVLDVQVPSRPLWAYGDAD